MYRLILPLLASLSGWKGYAAAAGAGALVAGIAVGTAQAWRYGEKIAALERDHAEGIAKIAQERQAIADAAARDAAQAMAVQQELQAQVAAADARRVEELAAVRNENEKLRADVAAGARRLRVSAVCPAAGDAQSVSRNSTAASMDDATGPRLAGAAERDYFTLRDRIAQSDAMIKGLQDYVRGACLAR